MISPPRVLTAEPVAVLPDELRWSGPANAWTEAARPGQRLHSFLEGPCVEPDGSVLLVDVPYGRIFRISPEGAWTVALDYDGQPHAVRPLGDGRHAVPDFLLGLLAVDLETGGRETLVDRTNTEGFRGLSDLCVAPGGDVWFTDSGRTSLTDPTGRLFVLRKDGALEQRLGNAPYPNGVALSPDGATVYVAMTRSGEIWALRADAPDPVWPMAGVFARPAGGLGPDGLAVDAAGRVAVAQAQAGRALVYSRRGDLLAVVRTPGGLWTTAVAFAPDGALLIVEAQGAALHRADLSDIPEEL